MRSLERWGMAKEVWVRGERKKFYMAESDLWTVIRNVLSGREMREVQLALEVLGDSVEQLKEAEDELTPAEQQQAAYFLERIDDLRAFFQLAQMALATFVDSSDDVELEDITQFMAE
jgi:DNA-binding transcriptional regulator GbsR (MarR family)